MLGKWMEKHGMQCRGNGQRDTLTEIARKGQRKDKEKAAFGKRLQLPRIYGGMLSRVSLSVRR